MTEKIVLYGSGIAAACVWQRLESLAAQGERDVIWVSGADTLLGDDPLPILFSRTPEKLEGVDWRSIPPNFFSWNGKEWAESTSCEEEVDALKAASMAGFQLPEPLWVVVKSSEEALRKNFSSSLLRVTHAQTVDLEARTLRLETGEVLERANIFWLRPVEEIAPVGKPAAALVAPPKPARKNDEGSITLVTLDLGPSIPRPSGRVIVGFRYRSDRYASYGVVWEEEGKPVARLVLPVSSEVADQRETLAKVVAAWRRELGRAFGTEELVPEVRHLGFLPGTYDAPGLRRGPSSVHPGFAVLSPEVASDGPFEGELPLEAALTNLAEALRASRIGDSAIVDTEQHVSFNEGGVTIDEGQPPT